MTVHGYRFEPRVARWSRLFNIRADTSRVTVDQQRLVARFGPWTVSTTVDNVVNATITGPYRTWRVAGPARMSLSDRGITFASSTERGLCLKFARPVAGLDPLGLLRHPTLTVTVDDPDALAVELGIDGELAHADLAHGTLRRTAKTILRSLLTHRSINVAPPQRDTAAPLTDLPDDAQSAEAGIGPWFHRRYCIRILDPQLTSEALISAIQSDPNIICDTSLAPFVKDVGTPGQMNIGDRYTVRTAGPWDGPVEVVDIGPGHLRLATLEGHMEAGIIDIHAHHEGSAIDFEIESWARSADLAFHILYDVVGVAKTVQTEMWTTACERAAAYVDGQPQGPVQISETRSPYSGRD